MWTAIPRALVPCAVLALSSVAAGQQPQRPPQTGTQQAQPRKNVVVHLTKAGADPHAAVMALELATAMQRGGASVTLYLDLEGVRVADARAPNQVQLMQGGPTVAQLYDAFVAAGGQVVLCPHCATMAGLERGALRKGATLGTNESISRTLLQADQVVDY